MNFFSRIADAVRPALVKKAWLLRVMALIGSAALMTVSIPNPAEACSISDIPSCVALIFIKIFQLLTALMGWILVLEVDALIRISQYHNFVSPGPSAVQVGWIVTRDLANMFFIVVLLIIAFGTILGSSTYHYEKNLARLLIMAVVINFSKTICGIFIDMGQVIMLTFVNGFKEAAGGNFVNAFQVNKLLALADSGGGTYDFGMVVAMMFAFILTAIAASVVLVMLVIMIYRVVMLWVLIILSPIAFLASAVPKGGEYYSQWWTEFKKYIITGPVIAFFLWLALASVQHAGTQPCPTPPCSLASQGLPPGSAASRGEAASATRIGDSQIPTEAGASSDVIMNMIIAICIMFAGLKFASESKVLGAGVAGSIRSRAQKYARAAAMGSLRLGTGSLKRDMKRAASPLMSVGGGVLAKVPLIGGLGRAAVLTSEKWKKERQASAEKFAGGAEDFARLSPGAFNRDLKSLAKKGSMDPLDKKRLDGMVRAGLADPKTAQAMGKSGDGAFALSQLVAGSKGKGLQDAVGLAMSDPNARQWAKNDPTFAAAMYDKVKREAFDENGGIKDASMLKTIGELEQKFAPQLLSTGKIDGSKLKNIVPKMPVDDLKVLPKEAMAQFMPYLNAGQMRQLAQDGTPATHEAMLAAYKDTKDDAVRKDMLAKIAAGEIPASWFANAEIADNVLDRTKGDAKARSDALAKDKDGRLAARAGKRLEEALGPQGDSTKFVAALPDAISLGSLKTSAINSDAKLQAAIKQNANQIDIPGLGRNISVSDTEKTDAAVAMALLIGDVNPEKIQNARKSGMNEHVLPSRGEMETRASQARSAQSASLGSEAPEMLDALQKQLSALQASSAVAPSAAATEEVGKLTAAIQGLQQSVAKRDEALKSLEAMRDRIGMAEGNDKVAATLPMPKEQLDALKSAAQGFEKRLDELDNAIAKTVADVKGVKFDAGKQGGGQNRGGRRQG